MTHHPHRDELLDLALGLLEPAPARALEDHAAGCAACRAELAALRQTRQLVAGLPQLEAPASDVAPILAAARQAARTAAATRRPRWAAPRWLWGGTLGLAGATALAVLVLRVSAPPPPPLGEPDAGPAPATGRLAERAAVVDSLAEPPRSPPAPPVAAAPPPAPAKALRPGPAVEAKRELARAEPAEEQDAKAGRADLAAAAEPPARARRMEAPAAPKMSSASAPAPAPASVQPQTPRAALMGAAGAAGERPSCRLEQRRQFTRSASGLVVGRIRQGRYPAAGGEVALLVEERFGPDGRLLGATVSHGDRTVSIGREEIEAGRLEPLPGVVLAPTAAEAERAPPRCEP